MDYEKQSEEGVFLDKPTMILLGLSCELIGGILLASEMIGFLDKLSKWNSSLQKSLQNKIHSKPKELRYIALTAALFYISIPFMKLRLRDVLTSLYFVFSIYMLLVMNLISGELLLLLEYFTRKFGTKKVLGLLGVIFLFLGFLIQAVINCMAN